MGCNSLIHCSTLQIVDHYIILTAALCLCLYLGWGGLNERARQNKRGGGGQCWNGVLEGVLEGVLALEGCAGRGF